MDQIEIEKLIIKAVQNIQKISGRNQPTLSGASSVFNECEEFDSLNSVEVSVEVGNELQLELPNIFVEGNKVLTISEAARKISAFLKK